MLPSDANVFRIVLSQQLQREAANGRDLNLDPRPRFEFFEPALLRGLCGSALVG